MIIATLLPDDPWSANEGSGQPLPFEVRARMEDDFRTDFSSVRVHLGGAVACACGEDLFFLPDVYDPESTEGTRVIAHELSMCSSSEPD